MFGQWWGWTGSHGPREPATTKEGNEMPTIKSWGSLLLLFFVSLFVTACGSSSSPMAYPPGTVVSYPVSSGAWYIALDSSNNVWVSTGNTNSAGVITELTASSGYLTSTIIPTSNNSSAYSLAVDSFNHIWFTPAGNYDWAGYFNPSLPIYTYLSNFNASLSYNPYYVTTPDSPAEVAVDISGNIWVTNNASNNITEISNTGSILGTFNVGTYPMGVAVDGKGNIWVANNKTNNVTELSYQGTVLNTFPVGNAPNEIAVDPSGNLWVTNYTDQTVVELAGVGNAQTTGSIINTFSIKNNPEGIAVDSAGNVWVASATSDIVTEIPYENNTYSSSNEKSFTVGSKPLGIAIDSSGNVWVADTGDNTVDEIVGVAAHTVTPVIGIPSAP